MKGQFFIITAFALILAFYVGITLYLQPQQSAVSSLTMEKLSENLVYEYPHVVNMALNTTGYPETYLINFTKFARNVSSEVGTSLGVLWITTKNESNDLNITIGNHMYSVTKVTLNVSGDVKSLNITSDEVKSVIFSNPPDPFEVIITFNTTQKKLLFEKYKTNFYSFIEMVRNGERVVREVIA